MTYSQRAWAVLLGQKNVNIRLIVISSVSFIKNKSGATYATNFETLSIPEQDFLFIVNGL